MNITEKILKSHVVSGKMEQGEEIGIRIDQTLTQDATGTMAYLSFEALGLDKVRTDLSVSYVDHNTIQVGYENADDHLFLQSVAAKYGIYYSPAGNGICHQVHLERFGKPGATLLGSDSHTPTGGGIGMIAIGAGGLDVALAMAGEPFYLTYPEIYLIKLSGQLKNMVSAKDLILTLLKMFSVKGGVGRVFEYGGEGVKSLSVPERSTITNMGAELGLTTSIFPSDSVTKLFLKAQKRMRDFKPLEADKDAQYSKIVEIKLNELEPMAACPHSPDNVMKVKDMQGQLKVNQVAIGSCTNSSYKDLMTVAKILKGKRIHKDVSLVIAPASRQVLELITKNGALYDIIKSGARILETACGPCIGMGQAPSSGAVSLRTFNRNFKGRSGTEDANVYLVSPETAAVSALTGMLTDPRKIKEKINIKFPSVVEYDDNMIIPPVKNSKDVEILRGKNIKPLPLAQAPADTVKGKVILIVQDNITTDHILPGGAKILPLRSNIPAISDFTFSRVDKDFVARAKKYNGGIIIGGSNYGQGSSREHAAIAPMFLGVKMVIAKSFARIHRQNLINYGIIPAVFANETDYDKIKLEDELAVVNMIGAIKNSDTVTVQDVTCGFKFDIKLGFSKRERQIIAEGGLLNFVKQKNK